MRFDEPLICCKQRIEECSDDSILVGKSRYRLGILESQRDSRYYVIVVNRRHCIQDVAHIDVRLIGRAILSRAIAISDVGQSAKLEYRCVVNHCSKGGDRMDPIRGDDTEVAVSSYRSTSRPFRRTRSSSFSADPIGLLTPCSHWATVPFVVPSS